MALKLHYYGQNDSVNCTPNVALTGEPGVDIATLTAAGYLGGIIVGLVIPGAGVFPGEPAFGAIGAIKPCDTDASATDATVPSYPFGTLLNGPGEFAGAIGPSGSKKAPVVRAMWQGNINNEAYDPLAVFLLGKPLYCGSGAQAGNYSANVLGPIVGVCTHIPTAAEPWLGVASTI